MLARVKQECIRLENLPLLSSIVKANESTQPLADSIVLNIQHQLGDVTAEVEALIRLGARPSDLYFLPPAYTHHREFEDFVEKHYNVPRENFFPSLYRLRFDYETYRLYHVIYHIHQLMQRQFDRLLVLDDGGCFSEALATLFDIEEGIIDMKVTAGQLPSRFQLSLSEVENVLRRVRSIDIRLVEQTSRGLFKYLDDVRISKALRQLGISLVDVATSEPKKRLEPPIIAETAINMLAYLFDEAAEHLRIPQPSASQRCLLIGYGAIGRAVAHALTHDEELGLFARDSLQVFDRDAQRNETAQDDGYTIFRPWDQLETFDYIIGCAGRCSLSLTSIGSLSKQSYLISFSSAAIEFPFHQMIEQALQSPFEKKTIPINLDERELTHLDEENIHRNVTFTMDNGNRCTVVNGGMPVTFLGLLNPTHPERFDLTVSCMVAASIQAARTHRQFEAENRVHPLDAQFSQLICQWFD